MFLILFVIFLNSVIAASVMMYIALATSIGPWIGPLLVLLTPIFLRLLLLECNLFNQVNVLVGSSIGGILATACAFSLPAIYFIDANLYQYWLSDPALFIVAASFFCFLSGAFGIICSYFFEKNFHIVSSNVFPAGQLVFGMIKDVNDVVQRYMLFLGIIMYAGFILLQRLYLAIISYFQPCSGLLLYYPGILLHAMSRTTILPMLLSIGFIAGHMIALPLAIGLCIKTFFLHAIQMCHYTSISILDFSLAFCSGIILSGLLGSLIKFLQKLHNNTFAFFLKSFQNFCLFLKMKQYLYLLIILIILIFLMAYFIKVPIFFIIYVVITTAIASYFMAILAAKTGLAYLGRFATFVMIPAMVIFNCSPITLVLLATFVEIAGGVAVDVLSGRKIISLAEFNNTNFFAAQWFGLVIASITSAVVLWLLTNSLVLGSSDLVAYKAHTRALLIEIKQFEYIPMMFGLIVGTIASWFRINTGMLLGGILMPFETAIGLIIGAVFSFLVKDNANAYPISAGIFAANSLYMIFKAILG